MKKCWANILGECDSISREHVISESVFDGTRSPVSVVGNERVPDGDHSLSSLTAKILCRKHNSQLSLLDSEAGRLAQFVLEGECASIPTSAKFSGLLIERWLAKTTVNYVASGWGDSNKWLPGELMVKSIFGFGEVPGNCGMYAMDSDNLPSLAAQEIAVTPMWQGSERDSEQKRLSGAFVSLHRVPFFLAIVGDGIRALQNGLELPGASRFSNKAISCIHRPAAIVIRRESVPPQTVRFKWNTNQPRRNA